MKANAYNSSRRGSVIVVVLVTLMLAALMLVKFMEGSSVELTLATRQADRDRLRTDAYSALETALAVMAEVKSIDKELNTPAQGWADPYAYAGETPREGVQVEFSYKDESGKASLPKMKFEELVELAQSLGLGESDAKRFADGLFVWMHENHTPQEIEAEAGNYERASLPHVPPKRSLRSWDELRAVLLARDFVYDPADGTLSAFGRAFQDAVSLYDFKASNVNALAPGLGVARGWDSTQINAVSSYQTGKTGRPPGAPPWFRSMEDVTPILGANADMAGLDANAKLIRVRVTVREGAGTFRLEALVTDDDAIALPKAAEAATPPAPGAIPKPVTKTPETGIARPGTGKSAAGKRGEKLNYPFHILEVSETSGPPPDVTLPEEAAAEPTL
ncbi:MAG: type II secretion system protein GspK [Verrucomicrobia bacterium]|nr:type II secretion system protein GspK [Verrucomicrobiota bacterium]